ncbi:MAG: hypothetical protein SFW62_06400, partial [Alphaproteobacteria bacterium]|nr:hypothetical protein [Alphaproteobacteria bacterium]
KGPVFWYAANVPGPFYVNTELVIGSEIAGALLNKITDIVASTPDLATRAGQLHAAIMKAHDSSAAFQQVIKALIVKAKEEFPSDSYTHISGGERRDWIFSIPVAETCGLPHVYLFKNGAVYSGQNLKPGTPVLHISDLINNGASYLDVWLPALKKAGLPCAGTLCVNSRGTGVQKLEAIGLKAVALNDIDLGFFERSLASRLIDAGTLEEIQTYFASPRDWAARYLLRDMSLFDVKAIDPKSFERLQSFFTKDPWSLRDGHEDFFAAMQAAIAERQKNAA